MVRRWQWAIASMWILGLTGSAGAGGQKVISLADNVTVGAAAYFPAIDVRKYTAVSLLGSVGSNNGVVSASVDCRFTLGQSSDFASAQTVEGFQATVSNSGNIGHPTGVAGPFPAPVAGPFMLCRQQCDGTTVLPCSGGPLNLSAVLFTK